jgi:hypothetical protein
MTRKPELPLPDFLKMRHTLILTFFLFLMSVSASYCQTGENYVKTYRARTATTSVASVISGTPNQSYKSFTYLDGLGRPKQSIGKSSTSTGKDLITPQLT